MRSVGTQDGFSLTEALVAVFVLVVGVLGTVAMVSAANDQTVRNLGEDAGNNLAREITEVARHIPFGQVQTAADAAASIRPHVPGSAAAAGTSWTVTRRDRDYTVSVDACRILAVGAGGCTTPVADPTEGADADTAILVDVLGLAGVDLGGGIPNALCGVFGPQFNLSVLPIVGVDATTCANQGSQGSVPSDPPRLARVSVTVAWSDRGRARQVTNSALIVDPTTLAPPR